MRERTAGPAGREYFSHTILGDARFACDSADDKYRVVLGVDQRVSAFWISVVLITSLMPLVVTVNVLPTFRPTNWVLKVCGDRIYLMLRNYRNRHSPDDGPLVVCFQFNEIESVAKQEKQICVPGSYRWQKIYWTERHLEIDV